MISDHQILFRKMDTEPEVVLLTKQFKDFEAIRNLLLLINEIAAFTEVFVYCFDSEYVLFKNEQTEGVADIKSEKNYSEYLHQYENPFFKELPLKHASGACFGKLGLIYRGDFEIDDKMLRSVELVANQIALTISKDSTVAQNKTIKELANSDDRFRSIIQNVSDIITLVDRKGDIIYTSPSTTDMLGYTPEEMIGVNMFQFIHPEDIAVVSKRFSERLQIEGNGELIEFRALTKSGKYILIETLGNIQLNNPSFNAVLLISRDVTTRRKIEEAIRLSEEKLRALVHNISDIITIVSKTGEIIYQSASARQVMGYEENELRTRHFSEIVHPEDFPGLMAAFKKTLETTGVTELVEFRLLDKDGNYFYIEAQATNQIDNPNIGGLIVTSRDISVRKKAEEERKLLIKELTKNNADLKQFSYIVSHNLRAPLTNLMSMLNLLDYSTISTERSMKLMEGYKTTTFSLNDTLNDLISILLVKNNTNIQIEEIPFVLALNRVILSIETLINESDTKINADFTEAPLVKFNQPYLESIFQNLITNSIRYKHSSRAPEIFISTSIKENEVIFTFTDNGIGFNMELVKDKIFGLHQKFHHHPESRGIGLYLIHAQITSFGGTIQVESEVNKGTRFTIAFKNN